MLVDVTVVHLAMVAPAVAARGRWIRSGFGAGAFISGLYRLRTTIEAQGIGWSAWRLAAAGGICRRCSGLIWTGSPPGLAVRWVASRSPPSSRRGWGVARAGVGAASWAGLRPALLSGPPAAVQRVVRRLPAFPEAGLRVVAPHRPSGQTRARRIAPSTALTSGSWISSTVARSTTSCSSPRAATTARTTSSSRRRQRHRVQRRRPVHPAGHGSHGARGRPGRAAARPGRLPVRSMPGKRVFDVVASAALLFLMVPLLAVIAVAVMVSDGGPVFYGQRRVGRDGRQFRIWKFRSMVVGADQLLDEHRDRNVNDGLLFKVDDDPARHPGGRHPPPVLRSTSCPSSSTCCKGDMSFVGPRPLPVDPDDVRRGGRQAPRRPPRDHRSWQVARRQRPELRGHGRARPRRTSRRGRSARDLWLLLRTAPRRSLVRRAPVI